MSRPSKTGWATLRGGSSVFVPWELLEAVKHVTKRGTHVSLRAMHARGLLEVEHTTMYSSRYWSETATTIDEYLELIHAHQALSACCDSEESDE